MKGMRLYVGSRPLNIGRFKNTVRLSLRFCGSEVVFSCPLGVRLQKKCHFGEINKFKK